MTSRKTDIWFSVAIGLLMLLLAWIKADTYEFKQDIKEVKVALTGHVKDQSEKEINVAGRIARIETLVCGKVYAGDRKE